MKWDSVHITDKIYYLKELLNNSVETDGLDKHNTYIVDALITGSQNTYSGDMGFEIQPHHIKYLKKLWDSAIDNQIDNSITDSIKLKLNKS